MSYFITFSLLLFLFLFCGLRWALDLRFYWLNDWDFEKQHEGFIVSYHGVDGDTRLPISNRVRVLVAMPLTLAALGAILFIMFLVVA